MKCPNCNVIVEQQTIGEETLMLCPRCGWTGSHVPVEEIKPPKPRLFFVIIGWIFAVVLLAGPYIAARIYLPPLPTWAHVVYWLLMMTYLMAAATTDAHYDDTNLGLLGGLIDNPFTYEDDYNRAQRNFGIFLIPGKAVVWTISATWRWMKKD